MKKGGNVAFYVKHTLKLHLILISAFYIQKHYFE